MKAALQGCHLVPASTNGRNPVEDGTSAKREEPDMRWQQADTCTLKEKPYIGAALRYYTKATRTAFMFFDWLLSAVGKSPKRHVVAAMRGLPLQRPFLCRDI